MRGEWARHGADALRGDGDMKFKLYVEMDNAAFGEDSGDRGVELARVLRTAAERRTVLRDQARAQKSGPASVVPTDDPGQFIDRLAVRVVHGVASSCD